MRLQAALTIAAMAMALIARGAEQTAITDDKIMGDYVGAYSSAKGSPLKAEAKVIAEGTKVKGFEGKSAYRAVLSTAPAEKEGQAVTVELRGPLEGDQLPLADKTTNPDWTGKIANEKLTVEPKGESSGRFELKHVVLHSPTEGRKPPAGAIVLLPYEPGKPTNLDEWTIKTWKILPDGSVEITKGSNRTVRQFGDVQLHVEFLCPYQPQGRGQGRGNSGVYLAGRYEVQVLDSFGLRPTPGDCGGIYGTAAPKVNACFPPLSWQTYDITFRTARLAADGAVEKPGTLTVLHNGVKIHDQQEMSRGTAKFRRFGQEPTVGPVLLQDHGHPVCYRNIWLVELKDEPPKTPATK